MNRNAMNQSNNWKLSQEQENDSAGNTPLSQQIDPSPTAERLLPGFLKDEINNKVPVDPVVNNQNQPKSKLNVQSQF